MKPVLLFSMLLGLYGFLCLDSAVYAQNAGGPSHTRAAELVGETVADRASEHYRFEIFNLVSDDGQRHYRVQVGIPRIQPPQQHILYMLDGNAAIATLTADHLAQLASGNAPVLVAIGYDIATRNDVVSRAYDYTPPVFLNGERLENPVVRGRAGGGAGLFLELIDTQVKPKVRSLVDANGEEWIWGHSYGGLFALHVLFTRPESFDAYIVGDPSAWWYEGALIKEWEGFDPAQATGKRVGILVGTRPRPADRPAPDDVVLNTGDGRSLSPREAVKEIAKGLQRVAHVEYREFPDAGHGEMIEISLLHALRAISNVKLDLLEPVSCQRLDDPTPLMNILQP